MKNVLVIWEVIPEQTKFYLLKISSEAVLKEVLAAHTKYIGADSEDSSVVMVAHMLEGQDQTDYVHAFDAKALDIDYIVSCGVIL